MDATTPGPDVPSGSEHIDLALRLLGGLVAVAGALVTALIEVFLAPLRVGTFRVPLSPVLAVTGNLALVWFSYRATGRRAAIILPALVWMAVMIAAAGRTNEGDLLLTGDNPVGLVTIFAGVLALAVAAYRLILPRRQDRSHRS